MAELPARKKVGQLSGEVVPLPGSWAQVERQAKIYLVELTPQAGLDCSKGNVLKHLNHSCSPNCYLRVAGGRVEVYALRAIASGTELTVDYGLTPHAGGMTCRCGSPHCRGVI